MQVKLLLTLLIIIGLINIKFMVGDDDKFIIASHSQKQCLMSFYGGTEIKEDHEIYGPEILKNFSIITLNSDLTKDFTYEVSSCFYDSEIPNVTPESLSSVVGLLKSQGVKEIYFFKSPHSESFTVYGKQ